MLAASMVVLALSLVVVCDASSASLHERRAQSSTKSARERIPSNTELADVAFLSPTRGYGLFVVEGSVTCSDRVGATTNGGARFSLPVFVTSWRCANTPPARSLAFDDHGDGFLYGPRLLITHNSGATWTSSPQPGSILSVEVLGSSIWMLETSRPVPSPASNNSTNRLLLFDSSNGGRTWSTLPTPRPADVEPANAVGSGWLVRISPTSAYLAANPRVRNGRQVDATPLWFTSDSGATWFSRTIPCSSFNTNIALSVSPGGTLFDVCASEPSAGEQPKETLRSTNEGRTWHVRSMCHFSPAAMQCTPGSQTGGYLGEIDAVSGSTVYLVGGRSSLDVSRDGGIKWMAVPPGLGSTAGGTSQVTFFTPSVGIVLGDGDQENERPTLWSTTDGGVRWSTRVPEYS